MSAVVSINDNNLLIRQGDSIARSQGFAWMKDGDVYFDLSELNNAVHSCRLEPAQINSHYWQQCEQTAIASNDAGMRHAADLVWRHLTALKSEHGLDEIILLVPSHYQPANLQLLLGIAKAVGVQVSGLLNKAVLELREQVSAPGSYLHIDMQLHQTVCSEVVVDSDELRLGKVEVLHEVGLQAMQDALLKAIQDRFILGDRFDPLHYAETEQQLFDQLPKLAQVLARDGKANVAVSHEQRHHATSIDARQWQAALERPLAPLMNLDMGLTVAHSYVNWNGFHAADAVGPGSSSLNFELPASAVLRNLLAGSESDQVIYQTTLALGGQSAPAQPTVASAPQPQTAAAVSASKPPAAAVNSDGATHLLQAGVAVPLSTARVSLENAVLAIERGESSNVADLLANQSLFVMGDQARLELRPNDRLGSNLADGVITVIRVVGGDH